MGMFVFGDQPTPQQQHSQGVTILVNAVADAFGLERSSASTGVGSVGSVLNAGITSDGVSAAVAQQRSIAERERETRERLRANQPVMAMTDP